jgi:hypothetical protein
MSGMCAEAMIGRPAELAQPGSTVQRRSVEGRTRSANSRVVTSRAE